MAIISPSRRLRRTPFSDAVESAGVGGYTVYNHTLLPTFFESVEADYRHLKRHVQLWDVSCERQVELKGRDAFRLMQRLTPRDLSGMTVGQCLYVPVVDEDGGMLNDPVALKLGEDRFWISTADSDLLFWVKGVACGSGLSVDVDEPGVSPLAIQGPRSDDLAARVFGDGVRDLRFFRFGWFEAAGRQMLVARSGFSRQGGFEIYVEDAGSGIRLWDALIEAGRDLNVRAGCPNTIERIEGGLLSYGNDMTRENSPYECGLGKFCNPRKATSCIGRDALMKIEAGGPAQQIRPVRISGRVPACDRAWPVVSGGRPVGQVTSAAWSPDFGCTVAIGMIRNTHWQPGTELVVETQAGAFPGLVRERFWA